MSVHKFPTKSPMVPQPTVDDRAAVEFQSKCFTSYANRCASRGFTNEYVSQNLAQVSRLLKWSGKELVELTEDDYEAWTTHLGNERKLLASTQRTYQKGIRQVFGHLVTRQHLQNEATQLFGRRIELIAHRENSIVHSTDQGGSNRPPLSHDQMQLFFDTIDAAIDRAEVERPRALRGMQRDYAVIFTGYVYGLQSDELCSLTPNDWRPCPDLPELGDFGLLFVRRGKGANGSGKRSRPVPTTHADYPRFLQWYLTQVRPLYRPDARRSDPIFFNERGGPITGDILRKAFKRLIIEADLDPAIYSPHSLRRSMCQHEMMRAPTEFARAKAGHKSASTTQIYGQVPVEHLRRSAARLVREQLRSMRSKGDSRE